MTSHHALIVVAYVMKDTRVKSLNSRNFSQLFFVDYIQIQRIGLLFELVECLTVFVDLREVSAF